MQEVKITCLDFRQVLDQVPADSWTFVDPCYHCHENLYDDEMTYDDHVELRDRLVTLPNPFFMTIGLNELTHGLYVQGVEGLHIREHHYGTMNLLKGGCLPSTELYVRNYLNF